MQDKGEIPWISAKLGDFKDGSWPSIHQIIRGEGKFEIVKNEKERTRNNFN